MGIRIEEHLTCGSNPSGIVINNGWYALAECILVKTHPSKALLRWCGLRYDATKPRKKYTPRDYVPPDATLRERVLEIYRNNPNLQNTEIAKMVGRSKTFVSRVLLGVGIKRNRWDKHKKGGTKNEETL